MPFGFCTNSNIVKTSNTFQNDGCDTYTNKLLLLEKEQLEATISVLVPSLVKRNTSRQSSGSLSSDALFW